MTNKLEKWITCASIYILMCLANTHRSVDCYSTFLDVFEKFFRQIEEMYLADDNFCLHCTLFTQECQKVVSKTNPSLIYPYGLEGCMR